VLVATVVLVGWYVAMPRLLDSALHFEASRELDASSTSPSGRWTVHSYYLNPGAAGRSWYTVELVDNGGERSVRQLAELYDSSALVFAKHGDGLALSWKSDSMVVISGHKVDVPDGYLSQ
jgi:hypothetical protein